MADKVGVFTRPVCINVSVTLCTFPLSLQRNSFYE